ncbi:MAG TPA: polysaccharide deacetylase family protein [bacterium]
MQASSGARRSLTLAERSGLAALALAVVLLPLSARVALVPPALFLVLCLAAPLFPAFSFFLPIVSRGCSGRPAVALTFDDGPDPQTTSRLLDLLARHGAPATFFITGQKAQSHPGLVRAILDAGHTVGNHSYSHDNLIMFKSTGALVREIEGAQEVFRQLGFRPLAFRPPVGVTNPRLAAALARTGLYVVNFSRRAADRGNRSVTRLSRRILERLRSEDIIMLHDVAPRDPAGADVWLSEVDRILAGIRAQGLAVLPLGELIQRPVMATP